jgi:hypothetical protein
MAIGGLKYKVECLICGKHFIVDKLESTIPKHAPKGEIITDLPYIPCAGSNSVGVYVDTLIEGFDI